LMGGIDLLKKRHLFLIEGKQGDKRGRRERIGVNPKGLWTRGGQGFRRGDLWREEIRKTEANFFRIGKRGLSKGEGEVVNRTEVG